MHPLSGTTDGRSLSPGDGCGHGLGSGGRVLTGYPGYGHAAFETRVFGPKVTASQDFAFVLPQAELQIPLRRRLRAVLAQAHTMRPCRVILADHHPRVSSDMGASARPVIEEALAALGTRRSRPCQTRPLKTSVPMTK